MGNQIDDAPSYLDSNLNLSFRLQGGTNRRQHANAVEILTHRGGSARWINPTSLGISHRNTFDWKFFIVGKWNNYQPAHVSDIKLGT